jgi:hypothetical protein
MNASGKRDFTQGVEFFDVPDGGSVSGTVGSELPDPIPVGWTEPPVVTILRERERLAAELAMERN